MQDEFKKFPVSSHNYTSTLLNIAPLENEIANLKKRNLISDSKASFYMARIFNLEELRRCRFQQFSQVLRNRKNLTGKLFDPVAESFNEKSTHGKSSKRYDHRITQLLTYTDSEIMNQIPQKRSKLHDFYLEDNDIIHNNAAGLTINSNRQEVFKGYKSSDFLLLQKYKIIPERMPLLSNVFYEYTGSEEQNPETLTENNFAKMNKNGNSGSMQKAPVKFSRQDQSSDKSRPPKSLIQEAYNTYEEVLSSQVPKEKEQALTKISYMSANDLEKYEKTQIRRGWQNVCKAITRLHKFIQKTKQDNEQACKRLAYMCAKEVKRRIPKNQRSAKENVFRSKKLHREMLTYWRRREKELNDIKKRKDRLEAEMRKREEEAKEALLQKKRLEFLMRQSEEYAQLMARKLGMLPVENNPNSRLVDVDENMVLDNVNKLIQTNNERLKEFKSRPQAEKNNATSLDTMNTDLELDSMVTAPTSFKGVLKVYQLKGLRWLDNLYDQGINGILADEMGLGKTIQAIALLAHLGEQKDNWGPFLVVAPASTLYNWQQEIQRFAPALKVLPYWGSLKERKIMRKYFNDRGFGIKYSPFHVVVTSYQMVVSDEKTFQKMRWQYMILDEAQAIKNLNSQRWNILLNFNARNKLLLTGTPIQNSMAELWALLHFIMPSFFDSHEEFQEWFSKDIEAHSQDQKELNKIQLNRLHAILKPFMLRRVKKDVESEIGKKTEHEIYCEMTRRQRELYNGIKSRLSVKDFFMMLESKAKVENLMNLVMQFRKVCNHPELFERRMAKSPFNFRRVYYYSGNTQPSHGALKMISCSWNSPIEYHIPKIIFDDIYLIFEEQFLIIQKHFMVSLYEIFPYLVNIFPFNILELFTEKYLLMSMVILHYFLSSIKYESYILQTCYASHVDKKFGLFVPLLLQIGDSINEVGSFNDYSRPKTLKYFNANSTYFDLINKKCYNPAVLSVMPHYYCSSINFTSRYLAQSKDISAHLLFYGKKFKYKSSNYYRCKKLDPVLQDLINIQLPPNGLLLDYLYNVSDIEIPDFNSVIADSAKLKYLDALLVQLKQENHRVLIFCQMTKMMDILEEFLTWRRYKYFRLDGSCNIADRRDMVSEYQNNSDIFAFILSTRAGGLGVTLTAADTVIFYDNDWNPTVDSQAADRAHRIGQIKDVTVYRLVTKDTIETRILKRAQQKQTVQATVYSGGAFKADVFKPQEVMELLFDESELQQNTDSNYKLNKFINQGHMRRGKPQKNQGEGKKNGNNKQSELGKNQENDSKMDNQKNVQEGEKDEEEILDFSKLLDNETNQDEN